MNAAQVEWIPAVVTLAIGLAAGVLVYVRAVRARGAPVRETSTGGVQSRDLAAKRDALVLQLQELEDTASKRTGDQLARERYQLELEAAQVLLALDAASAQTRGTSNRKRAAKSASAASEVAAVPANPPAAAGLRSFFWGVASASVLILLGLFVYQSAKPREAGGSVTGEVPRSAAAAGTPASEDEARVEAALVRNPADVDARLALAGLKLERRDLMGVWNEAQKVLELAPGNPRGLAYQAFVRIAMGQPAMAIDLLRKALKQDPSLIDAHAWLALGYVRMGRTQDAHAAIDAASRRFPDRADEFRRYLAEIEREAAPGDASAAKEANPHAGVATAAAASPAALASGSRRHVAGKVELDPALLGKIPPRAVLFVFVRPAGVAAGPPSAAKRLAPVFPASFDLSEDDAMMGQPFPDTVLIEARLDEDGDPTTRPATDPKARIDGVKAGKTDVRLVLRRQ